MIFSIDTYGFSAVPLSPQNPQGQPPAPLPPAQPAAPKETLLSAFQKAHWVDRTGRFCVKSVKIPDIRPHEPQFQARLALLHQTLFFFSFPSCAIRLTYFQLKQLFIEYATMLQTPIVRIQVPGVGGPVSEKQAYCTHVLNSLNVKNLPKLPLDPPPFERAPLRTEIYFSEASIIENVHFVEVLTHYFQKRHYDLFRFCCVYDDNRPPLELFGIPALITYLLHPDSRTGLTRIQLSRNPLPFAAQLLESSALNAFLKEFDEFNARAQTELILPALLKFFFNKTEQDVLNYIVKHNENCKVLREFITSVNPEQKPTTQVQIASRDVTGQLHQFVFYCDTQPSPPKTTIEKQGWEFHITDGKVIVHEDVQGVLDSCRGIQRWIKNTNLTLEDWFAYAYAYAHQTLIIIPEDDLALQTFFKQFCKTQADSAPKLLAWGLVDWISKHSKCDLAAAFAMAFTVGAFPPPNFNIEILWNNLAKASSFNATKLPEPLVFFALELLSGRMKQADAVTIFQWVLHHYFRLPHPNKSTVPFVAYVLGQKEATFAKITLCGVTFLIPYDHTVSFEKRTEELLKLSLDQDIVKLFLESLGMRKTPPPVPHIHSPSEVRPATGISIDMELPLAETISLESSTEIEPFISSPPSQEEEAPFVHDDIAPPVVAETVFEALFKTYEEEKTAENLLIVLNGYGPGDNQQLAEGILPLMRALVEQFPTLREREIARLKQCLTALASSTNSRTAWLSWCQGLISLRSGILNHYAFQRWITSLESLSSPQVVEEGLSIIRKIASRGLKYPLKIALLLLKHRKDNENEWRALLDHVLSPLPPDAKEDLVLQHGYDLGTWIVLMKHHFPQMKDLLQAKIPTLCHALLKNGQVSAALILLKTANEQELLTCPLLERVLAEDSTVYDDIAEELLGKRLQPPELYLALLPTFPGGKETSERVQRTERHRATFEELLKSLSIENAHLHLADLLLLSKTVLPERAPLVQDALFIWLPLLVRFQRQEQLQELLKSPSVIGCLSAEETERICKEIFEVLQYPRDCELALDLLLLSATVAISSWTPILKALQSSDSASLIRLGYECTRGFRPNAQWMAKSEANYRAWMAFEFERQSLLCKAYAQSEAPELLEMIKQELVVLRNIPQGESELFPDLHLRALRIIQFQEAIVDTYLKHPTLKYDEALLDLLVETREQVEPYLALPISTKLKVQHDLDLLKLVACVKTPKVFLRCFDVCFGLLKEIPKYKNKKRAKEINLAAARLLEFAKRNFSSPVNPAITLRIVEVAEYYRAHLLECVDPLILIDKLCEYGGFESAERAAALLNSRRAHPERYSNANRGALQKVYKEFLELAFSYECSTAYATARSLLLVDTENLLGSEVYRNIMSLSEAAQMRRFFTHPEGIKKLSESLWKVLELKKGQAFAPITATGPLHAGSVAQDCLLLQKNTKTPLPVPKLPKGQKSVNTLTVHVHYILDAILATYKQYLNHCFAITSSSSTPTAPSPLAALEGLSPIFRAKAEVCMREYVEFIEKEKFEKEASCLQYLLKTPLQREMHVGAALLSYAWMRLSRLCENKNRHAEKHFSALFAAFAFSPIGQQAQLQHFHRHMTYLLFLKGSRNNLVPIESIETTSALFLIGAPSGRTPQSAAQPYNVILETIKRLCTSSSFHGALKALEILANVPITISETKFEALVGLFLNYAIPHPPLKEMEPLIHLWGERVAQIVIRYTEKYSNGCCHLWRHYHQQYKGFSEAFPDTATTLPLSIQMLESHWKQLLRATDVDPYAEWKSFKPTYDFLKNFVVDSYPNPPAFLGQLCVEILRLESEKVLSLYERTQSVEILQDSLSIWITALELGSFGLCYRDYVRQLRLWMPLIIAAIKEHPEHSFLVGLAPQFILVSCTDPEERSLQRDTLIEYAKSFALLQNPRLNAIFDFTCRQLLPLDQIFEGLSVDLEHFLSLTPHVSEEIQKEYIDQMRTIPEFKGLFEAVDCINESAQSTEMAAGVAKSDPGEL